MMATAATRGNHGPQPDDMAEVLAEGERVHGVGEDVADDEHPREAAGEPVRVDLAEERERSAAFAVMGASLT